MKERMIGKVERNEGKNDLKGMKERMNRKIERNEVRSPILYKTSCYYQER